MAWRLYRAMYASPSLQRIGSGRSAVVAGDELFPGKTAGNGLSLALSSFLLPSLERQLVSDRRRLLSQADEVRHNWQTQSALSRIHVCSNGINRQLHLMHLSIRVSSYGVDAHWVAQYTLPDSELHWIGVP